MLTRDESCPLCGKKYFEVRTTGKNDSFVDCEICGKVMVHDNFDPETYKESLYILSGWTRERTEKGEKPLTILPNDIKATEDGITVEAVLSLPSIPYSIDQKINKLLDAIHRKSRFLGDEVQINTNRDYPLAYLNHFSRSQLDYGSSVPPLRKILLQIAQASLLSVSGTEKNRFDLTIEGIRQIEHARDKVPDSLDCFVAMKFGDKLLDHAYKQAIVPAIKDAGYVPIQMAFLEHNNNIIDEMLACIRKSRFVIADLSFQNQNVYFEAGFAQGLSIPVIYTCHEFHVDGIKFDTQHTNQIRWVEPEELRVKLKNRILATIA